MQFLTAAVILIMGALAVAGHSHHGHSHDAVSYSVVTKHEDHHDNHGLGHHVALIDQGHHEHHGNNGNAEQHHEYHDDHAKYQFKYGVKDPKTGDIKDQWEIRDGDSVKGSYSFKEADGTTRVVNYSADKKKGFEATVHKIGQAHHEHGHGHGHHGYN